MPFGKRWPNEALQVLCARRSNEQKLGPGRRFIHTQRVILEDAAEALCKGGAPRLAGTGHRQAAVHERLAEHFDLCRFTDTFPTFKNNKRHRFTH
jgi:hypothetical protein